MPDLKKVNLEHFGDAEQSEVVEGNTFTSKAGVRKPGTLPKTNGMSLVGTYDKELAGHLSFVAQNDTMKAIAEDSTIRTNIPMDDFGDSEPNEVVAGKTFTSSSGFNKTGTFEGEEKTETAGTTPKEVNPTAGKYIKKMTINPTPTEDKEVTAGTSDVPVLPPDGKHNGNVTVHPTPTETKEITAGTSDVSVSPSEGKHIGGVTVHPTPSEEKIVTAGAVTQDFFPTSGMHMNKVKVNPTPTETKRINPKAFEQTVRPNNGYHFSEVTLNAVPNAKPENIREGIRICDVLGTLKEGKAGVDFGSFVLDGDKTEITIEHSLGVIPSQAYLLRQFTSSNRYTCWNLNGIAIRGGSSYTVKDYCITKTNTTVTFNSYDASSPFYGGTSKPMTWVVIA